MTITISEILTNGITFDFKNWQKHTMNTNELAVKVYFLFELLEKKQINYLLVGGLALLTYIEGRNTQDIDLILAREDVKSILEQYITDENKDFVRANFNDLQIYILLIVFLLKKVIVGFQCLNLTYL